MKVLRVEHVALFTLREATDGGLGRFSSSAKESNFIEPRPSERKTKETHSRQRHQQERLSAPKSQWKRRRQGASFGPLRFQLRSPKRSFVSACPKVVWFSEIPAVPDFSFSASFSLGLCSIAVECLTGDGWRMIFAFGGMKPLLIRLINPFCASFSVICGGTSWNNATLWQMLFYVAN